MSDPIQIVVGVDHGREDMTAIAALIQETTGMKVISLDMAKPLTATEIQQQLQDYRARHYGIVQAWEHKHIELLTGPRRKRWDQYGAYHRRQSKKWHKRRGLWA